MLRAPFPPPDQPILGVRDLTDLLEAASPAHAGRRVGLGERVRADQSHTGIVPGEVNQRARRFGGVSPTLARRHDAIGDLHHAVRIGSAFEPRPPDDLAGALLDPPEAEPPAIRAPGGT